MNRTGVCRRIFATVFGLALALAGSALPLLARTGRITGQAVQEETGSPLVGAEIRVAGTSVMTSTDANGRYLITQAPTGQQTLELSYLGRETVSERATVREGEVSTVDFSVGVAPIAVEGISVLGVRAMTQARALNKQQNSANIINGECLVLVGGDHPSGSAPSASARAEGV